MDYRDKDDNQENNSFDPTALLDELITRAAENHHSRFVCIRNFNEWWAAINYKRTMTKVANEFRKMCKNLYYAYELSILEGGSTLEILLSYKKLCEVADYYEKERFIAADTLNEYKWYILAGNFLNFIFGKDRPEEECIDYRGIQHESDESDEWESN